MSEQFAILGIRQSLLSLFLTCMAEMELATLWARAIYWTR
jgi:hypothetical protein